jgi:hypothetical protein
MTDLRDDRFVGIEQPREFGLDRDEIVLDNARRALQVARGIRRK